MKASKSPKPASAARRIPATPSRNADDLVVQAAWMYYQDGYNQHDIAQTLGVSRASVVNYLQQARERGYVRVTLESELFTAHRLSEAVCSAFGLKAAYVLPDAVADTAESIFQRVAHGAAVWLSALLEENDKLGVSWGRTVYEMAEALEARHIPGVVVSQLVGSMATPYGFTAEICSATLADKLGASCINLHAPAVLSNIDLARRLRAEPIIQLQMSALKLCNKAVFAAGVCDDASHIVGSGVATLDELHWYTARGATGVVCGRFIGEDGREIDGPLRERMMAIELDQLQGLDMGLLVSSGLERVTPMRSAINGGYVTHVATNVSTAEALIGDRA